MVDLLADNPILSPEQQLEQLSSFIEIHYPEIHTLVSGFGPFDPAQESAQPGSQKDLVLEAEQAVGRLPDVLTHSSQLVLGSGLDHSMPGVAFTADVTATEIDRLAVFTPPGSSERAILSLHGGPGWHGSGEELENLWRPTVAAIAQLSGVPVWDLDYRLPLLTHPFSIVEDVLEAVETIHGLSFGDAEPQKWDVLGFGSSAAAAIVAASIHHSEKLVLQQPRLTQSIGEVTEWLSTQERKTAELPFSPHSKNESEPHGSEHAASNDAIHIDLSGTEVLIQSMSQDSIADDPNTVAKELEKLGATVNQEMLIGHHIVCTPEQARARTQSAAEFLKG